MKNAFIQAIHSKNKIRVTFFSEGDGSTHVHTCAPVDYGPSRHDHGKKDRFHMWDYDNDIQCHTFSLPPEQIISIQTLEEQFDPGEFIIWRKSWFVPREWGQYS
jgi:hypothetical protein